MDIDFSGQTPDTLYSYLVNQHFPWFKCDKCRELFLEDCYFDEEKEYFYSSVSHCYSMALCQAGIHLFSCCNDSK